MKGLPVTSLTGTTSTRKFVPKEGSTAAWGKQEYTPRQRKATYEPHPSSRPYDPLPGELDTEYAKRIASPEAMQKQVDTWNGIRKNTWQHGHHDLRYHTGYYPKDQGVVQSRFSTPRDNGAGGKETFLLEPREGSVDVYTIPEGRNKSSLYKGLVRFEENGKLPTEQYQYLTSGGFGKAGARTKLERQQFNRVLGDANRAMRDFLHNAKATAIQAAKYAK
jgi:hypothetical protein